MGLAKQEQVVNWFTDQHILLYLIDIVKHEDLEENIDNVSPVFCLSLIWPQFRWVQLQTGIV